MPFKEFKLQEIGLVKIYKRRGAKNIRLSLPRSNYVRVSIPSWLPYSAGIAFAHQKRDWIRANARTPIKSSDIKKLKSEAEKYLPKRLEELAALHDFNYSSLKLRHLRSRWGSCSTKKDITLNIRLMELPKKLIDHVILHELLHTKVLKHGPDFWQAFEKIEPNAKQKQKLLRAQTPHF